VIAEGVPFAGWPEAGGGALTCMTSTVT